MRRRVEDHVPGRGGRPAAQARRRRAARRRVHRAAAAARARPGRRVDPQRQHADRARGAGGRRVRRARARRPARRLLPVAARARAPDPARPDAAHPPHADRRGGPAPARARRRDARRGRGRAAWSGGARCAARSASLHEELFYRPLLPATAQLSTEEASLAPEAARARLRAIGYRDPSGALRHITALTEGVSRRAAIQRQLLPVMLGWFADGADPDAGLLAFRRLSDELGTTHWYLKLLRDSGTAGPAPGPGAVDVPVRRRRPRPARRSRWPGSAATRDLLPRVPPSACRRGRRRPGARATPRCPAATALRALRRRELARSAAADLLDVVHELDRRAEPHDRGRRRSRRRPAHRRGGGAVRARAWTRARPRCSSSRWAGSAAARWATRPTPTCCSSTSRSPAPTPAVAQAYAITVATRLRSLLGDAGARARARRRRRPAAGGPQRPPGAVLRRLRRVLRALVVTVGEPGAAAGPAGGGQRRARGAVRRPWSTPLRYPADGLRAARWCGRSGGSRRASRPSGCRAGSTRRATSSSAAAGISDVEWTAQLLQLRHAGRVPALRTTSTLEALGALGRRGARRPRGRAHAHRGVDARLAAARRARAVVRSGRAAPVPTCCPTTGRRWAGSPGWSATGPGAAATSRRTTCARRGGRAPSSTGCSTPDPVAEPPWGGRERRPGLARRVDPPSRRPGAADPSRRGRGRRRAVRRGRRRSRAQPGGHRARRDGPARRRGGRPMAPTPSSAGRAGSCRVVQAVREDYCPRPVRDCRSSIISDACAFVRSSGTSSPASRASVPR